ncbi:MAG: flavin reductase family protein [Planctomycetota bacterium]
MTSSPQSPSPTCGSEVASGLGRIPSGLFVVTWRAGERDHAMLASWVMQAGFAPPLLSVAVGTSRDLLAAMRSGAPFAVNVLADSQRSLLARFGKAPADGDDPFAGLGVDRTPAGVAVLSDAAGWLECRTVGEVAAAGGDHVIVLGRVEAAAGRPDTPPLIHVRRNGLKY